MNILKRWRIYCKKYHLRVRTWFFLHSVTGILLIWSLRHVMISQ